MPDEATVGDSFVQVPSDTPIEDVAAMARGEMPLPDAVATEPEVSAEDTLKVNKDVKDKPKSNAGAPTKYGPEAVQKLVAAIQRDFTVEEACHYAGISTSTYYNWLEEYPTFLDKIEQAKTYLFRKAKELITDEILTNKDGKTAQWYLTKRHKEYNPHLKVDLGGDINVTNKDAKLLEFIESLGGEDADEPDTEPEAPSS